MSSFDILIGSAVLLPLLLCGYWLLSKHRMAQNWYLLLVSYAVYAWADLRFLGLIFLISSIDYLIGLQLMKSDEPGKRKGLVLTSIFINLAVLFVFKYFNFFVSSFNHVFNSIGLTLSLPLLSILMPLGISFYIFRSLSYTIDLYRKNIDGTKEYATYLTYVGFFPYIVAGPIERAGNMIPQLEQSRELKPEDYKDALRQILWGFLKKFLVADTLAAHVALIFGQYQYQPGWLLILGAFFYTIQIYADFSGYTDFAVGVSKLFGLKLQKNFDYPYFSRDIAEFWRRWHISMSSWFRDYVYVSLGGISATKLSTRLLFVLITFTISGLWHGAAWTFVCWGLINGLFLLPRMSKTAPVKRSRMVAKGRWLPSLKEARQLIITFVLVMMAWVIFRSDSLAHAIGYYLQIFKTPLHNVDGFNNGYLLSIILSVSLLFVEWIQRKKAHPLQISNLPVTLRWSIYIATILVTLVFGKFGGGEFIYARF